MVPSLRLSRKIFSSAALGGAVYKSLGIRADKEPIKVLYSPKLYLSPLPKSHHIRAHRRLTQHDAPLPRW